METNSALLYDISYSELEVGCILTGRQPFNFILLRTIFTLSSDVRFSIVDQSYHRVISSFSILFLNIRKQKEECYLGATLV
jgi:hypothetical protein